ncbi:carbohydrate sulfotransferase 1-like [Mercenaria mercenaria]|uniref:carbohydrate sulfotransferase 1-like n=1 Tax=Mercenaria mercenaria TaxID=6596 RepID=UPI001E1DDB80|nr:carbohydrate sulfotransferase 1-like [Mercenaria mercenaria]
MCGCHYRIFYRKKYKLLIAVLCSAIICLHLRNALDKYQKHSMDRPSIIRQSVQIKKYDVLLSSYMRSGSTLMGIILGWRKDAFYLYEPLWKISMWSYWHGNETVCRSNRFDCRKVASWEAVQDKDSPATGSLVTAMKILKDIYDCQFNDFATTVFHQNVTAIYGGPSWSQTIPCNGHKRNNIACLQKYIPEKCKNATHRVAKVLRLSTDLLEDILRARENLKVIHLFRDPRAIINSRIKTRWYPASKENEIIEVAKSLCYKMLYDFQEGQKLLKLFPDRFKFIYYEDLNENPFNKSEELFKYLGMDLDKHKYPELRNLTAFSNVTTRTERMKNTAFWWRKSLKWDILQKIDPVCKNVYTKLGYKCFTNLQEYNNLSIASVNIPKTHLIV